MSNQWYYARGGQQHGPVTEAELKRLAESGQLQPRDLVWSEGMENWVEAGTVPHLLPAAPPSPQSPPHRPPAYPTQPIGYATPQGYPQPLGYAPTPPPSYLAQAIIVTILCCIPLGIPAIVFAAQVNSKWMAGDHRGAWEASSRAKTWSWVAFAAGLAPAIIGVLLLCAGISAEL